MKITSNKYWILIGAFLLAFAASTTSYAQLLEDRNKLKTAKRESGFILFRGRIKDPKPSSRHKTENARKARITRGHAGDGSNVRINPRYTVGHAGKNSAASANPQNTKSVAGPFTKPRLYVRYTEEQAGKYPKRRINPRKSTWDHTARVTFINPRFSKAPSYSKTKPPYSKQHSFLAAISRNQPEPRHLPGAYSDFGGGMNANKKKKGAGEYSDYTGKIKKLTRGKDMHPSANYLYARYNQNRIVRNTKRKINVVWVRMYGNQEQPDAVKKKSKKSKFDKDEIEIWNN